MLSSRFVADSRNRVSPSVSSSTFASTCRVGLLSTARLTMLNARARFSCNTLTRICYPPCSYIGLAAFRLHLTRKLNSFQDCAGKRLGFVYAPPGGYIISVVQLDAVLEGCNVAHRLSVPLTRRVVDDSILLLVDERIDPDVRLLGREPLTSLDVNNLHDVASANIYCVCASPR